ncbi:hypothetical protein BJF85_23365 [Saccharomonospora sp. CUA-673]|nr:hypothetical protein BJF85_23365 [Saccharomonospora sp. CUA-673]
MVAEGAKARQRLQLREQADREAELLRLACDADDQDTAERLRERLQNTLRALGVRLATSSCAPPGTTSSPCTNSSTPSARPNQRSPHG